MKIIPRLAIAAVLLGLILSLARAWNGEGDAERSGSTFPVPPAPAPAAGPAMIHVSPSGSDDAEGTREKPLATLNAALARVPASEPATICLLGGVYREQVVIPPAESGSGKPARLTIAAAPGEEVIFEGGEAVREWETYPDRKTGASLFIVPAPGPETIFAYEWLYYDIWEDGARIRYRKQNDEEGVKAYPGSICVLDDHRILVHTRDGRPPGELGLWRNRLAFSMKLGRDHVRLEGITFRNFTGGSNARALTITATGVEVDGCRFFNCVRGISNSGTDVTISNCEMREVGLGILNVKDNTTIEDCLIESAAGRFAFSDLNEHLRDGIRFYYPARGGTVRGCLTVGFWGGLYIKTGSSGPDSLPFLIENNTFLDGINCGSGAGSPPPFAGTAGQPKSTYIANLIGPNEHANDAMLRLPGIGADVRENYFFSRPGMEQAVRRGDRSNAAGAVPFADLAAGDLALGGDAPLPRPDGGRIGSSFTRVAWNPNTAAFLAVRKESAATPGFAGRPTVASSREGAIITATLTRSAPVVLKVRKADTDGWITVRGIEEKKALPEESSTTAPVERRADLGARFGFDLATGGHANLAADQDYEFVVEIVDGADDSKVVDSTTGRFRTSGGPKTVFVEAGAPDRGTGTERKPFDRLQSAFDVALPGDTIRLGAGVHTHPAMLIHGGTAENPITIKGSGKRTTLLDGGKDHPVMIGLTGVSHVTLSDLTMRWFGLAGISATDCAYISVLRSHFQNSVISGGERNGVGILLMKSPHSTVSHCTFTALENGIIARDSPFATIVHNTAFRNMYAGASLIGSAAHSTIAYNSLTFTGNDSMVISEPDRDALEETDCDFNNYGTFLRKDAKRRPENDVAAPPRYGRVESKAMIRGDIGTARGVVNRFFSLGDWREFSRKDLHSIFADPLYADPMKGDFRLLPGSPNLLSDGRFIGAEPLLEPTKNVGKLP